jgi:hypothetical protein
MVRTSAKTAPDCGIQLLEYGQNLSPTESQPFDDLRNFFSKRGHALLNGGCNGKIANLSLLSVCRSQPSESAP